VTEHICTKRTNDPQQADVIVVLYAHDSHCKCLGKGPWCRGKDMKEIIRGSLLNQYVLELYQSDYAESINPIDMLLVFYRRLISFLRIQLFAINPYERHSRT